MGHNHVEISEDKSFVCKSYASRISYDQELAFYKIVENSELTPALMATAENMLELEYVQGETLHQLAPSLEIFERLAWWYIRMEESFYRKTGCYCCLEDANFCNFIVSETRFAGVDFEDWSEGTLARALAMPLAYIHTMDCPEVEKRRIIARVNEIFGGSGVEERLLNLAVEREISALLRRRSARVFTKKTSGAIFMGGEGKRLGGVKKYNLLYGNYTYLEHLAHQLEVFDEVFYSVRTSSDFSTKWGTVVEDIQQGGGPAAGLAALLNHCKTDYLFVWPCDTPFLSREFLTQLLARFDPAYDGIVPVVDGRRYPLCALYSVDCRSYVTQQVCGGVRKLVQLLDGLNIQYLAFETLPRSLYNVNTERELKLTETL